MTEEQAAWEPEAIRRVQEILDRSADSATPVIGRVFARADWRLDAKAFLSMWRAQRW